MRHRRIGARRFAVAFLSLLLVFLAGCGLAPGNAKNETVEAGPVIEEPPEETPDPEQEERDRRLAEALDGFLWEDGYLYAVDREGNLLKDTYVGVLRFDKDGRYTSGLEELDDKVAEIIRKLTGEPEKDEPADEDDEAAASEDEEAAESEDKETEESENGETADREGGNTAVGVGSGKKKQGSIAGRTDMSLTRMEMLKAAYEYVRDNTRYVGFGNHDLSVKPAHGKDGWMTELALYSLENGSGNCYHFAAAFAALARGLGYQAYAAAGVMGALEQEHGWVEIVDDSGKIYICDPETEYSRKYWQDETVDLFYKTEENGGTAGISYRTESDPFAPEARTAKRARQ